ncbi:hypothetical protein N7G274_009620 [Stereocaulon virgatum]|uniref:Uncharacterized protein n=1 Tax=Stereocaulon virgatum TaxID=373712 RepID=A0ABR3ZWZ1_9LECA
MSRGGKNKEAEPDQNLPSRSNEEDALSFAGRLGASASGLLQTTFGNQTPGAVIGDLASLTADTTKGGPSTPTSTGESSLSSQVASFREDIDAPDRSLARESFRSGQDKSGVSAGYGQAAFDEFAANPRTLQPDLDLTQKPSTSSGWPSTQADATADHDTEPFSEVERYAWKILTREEEHPINGNDGAAVVALLSDPTFNVDEEPSDSWPVVADSRDQDKLGSPRLELPPYKPGDPLAPINPLDLIPDFNSCCDSMHTSNRIWNSTSYEGQSFSDPIFGDTQPWVDILNRYHDEVWGDMLPLVQEAREEAKLAEVNPEGALQDRPALRRLGMLLKHLNQLV